MRIALAAACLTTVTPAVAAQEPVAPLPAGPGPGKPPPALRLRLVSPPALLKAPVFVNAILANGIAAELFELRETLVFPRKDVVFVRARLGIAGDAAGATLVVELQDASGTKVDQPDKAERLQVTISSKKPLPGGPLAEFQFRQVNVKEQTIRVHHVAEARDRTGTVMPALVFSDVHLTVTKDVGMKPLKVFACFFYMH